MNKKLVAVVVPVTNSTEFTASEKISLAHIHRYLSRYPRFFLCHEGHTLDYPGFQKKIFAKRHFGSVAAHNRLLMSSEFYRAFSDYEYILIHHLDSLVFSDELETWCTSGYDLIAPPWIPGPDLPWCPEPGVGNGGFSLRRVESFISILYSRNRWREPRTFRAIAESSRSLLVASLRFVKDTRYRFRFQNGIEREIEAYLDKGGNEDRFWWRRGRAYYQNFRIAPVEVALAFAFEANPRACYKLNGSRIPFGCHAWERFDRQFWEPLLLDPRDWG